MEKKFNDTEFWGDKTPKAQTIKAQITKWDHGKLKNFSTTKKIINKMKCQPTE
jgi:hypothetical protein